MQSTVLSSLLVSSHLIIKRTLWKRNIFTFYKRPIREVNLPKVTKYIRDEIVSDSEAILLTTTLYIKVQTQETWENKNLHVHNCTNPRQHCSHFDVFHSGIVCFCFYHCHTLYMILYTIDPIYYNTNKKSKSWVMHGNHLRRWRGASVTCL